MAALSVSFSALFTALIVSCTIGSYESGDGEHSYSTAEMAVFSTTQEKITEGILDDDRTIIIASPISTAPIKKNYSQFIHNDSIRMMFHYNKAAENEKLTEASSAIGFTPVYQPKVALTDTLKAETKTDPVNLISSWKSKNGKYYNINIAVKTGVADEQKPHILGIVCDSVSQSPLSEASNAPMRKTTLHLRLTHDQNNMPLYYSSELYLSITQEQLLSILKHYGIAPSSNTEIIFTLNTFKGEEHIRM